MVREIKSTMSHEFRTISGGGGETNSFISTANDAELIGLLGVKQVKQVISQTANSSANPDSLIDACCYVVHCARSTVFKLQFFFSFNEIGEG